MSAALVALSALAACATTGHSASSADAHDQHADATSQQGRGQQADQTQRLHPLRDADEAQAHRARPRVDRQARARIGRADLLTQMAFWAGEYDTFPNDLEAVQRFAEALRKGGRNERAAQIAGEALQRFPDDHALLLTSGLAQLGAGNAQDALRPLQTVAHLEAQNWRVRSALGAALDQLGRFDEARRAYDEALAISPNQPDVLTNKGVSYLLSREPETAEPILRQAMGLPGAPAQARQNLAVALALQGRFDEAEQLQQADLPPRVVAENMSYLRGLLSDPHRWGDVGHN